MGRLSCLRHEDKKCRKPDKTVFSGASEATHGRSPGGHRPCAGPSGRPRDPASLAFQGTAPLCLNRSHDGDDRQRCLGSAPASRHVDPGIYGAPHPCIGTSFDAHAVHQTRSGGKFPPACRIVSVSPLLRELIVYSTTLPRLYEPGSHAGRIMTLILDLIRFRDTVPLDLPIPRDPRLRKIFDHLSDHPADGRTIEEWGTRVGATGRTLSRLFRAETGMTFHQWRQQLRLLEARDFWAGASRSPASRWMWATTA